MNNLVDKIYIINTEEATDRMSNVSLEMERHNISFERIEAISTDDVVNKPEEDTEIWNIRTASLLETTISIIENAKINNYERILIFEDDTYLKDDFYDTSVQNLSDFINGEDYQGNPQEWHFIHLNYSDVNKTAMTKYNNIVRLIMGCLCCQAYLVNNSVYDIYLDYLKKEMELPIDHITRGIHRMYKKSYIVTTPPVYHKKGQYSTLRQKNVDY
jgi:GR25 family glycosyltransferase involved in LPS biosynthesis